MYIGEVLFAFLLTIIIYTYLGYPALLLIIKAVQRFLRIEQAEIVPNEIVPKVSLIITVHNEEEIIEQKLKNSLSLDYPKDKIEVIVASDYSTDRTDDILRSYAKDGVKLNPIRNRVGKTAAQNQTVPLAQGEILIFTDANSIFQRDAILKLIRNFHDSSVGAVTGRLVYINDNASSVSAAEGLYHKYENFIRWLEGRVNSCTTANGGMLALRRELFMPMDPGFNEDCALPLWIAVQGKRVVFEPEAIYYEPALISISGEFLMRVRNTYGDAYSLLKLSSLLLPHPLLMVQYLSRMILRWTFGLWLVILFLSNIFLAHSPIFWFLLILQGLFYLGAIIGYGLEKKRVRFNPFGLPCSFLVAHIACLIGLMKAIIRGRAAAIWEKAEGRIE